MSERWLSKDAKLFGRCPQNHAMVVRKRCKVVDMCVTVTGTSSRSRAIHGHDYRFLDVWESQHDQQKLRTNYMLNPQAPWQRGRQAAKDLLYPVYWFPNAPPKRRRQARATPVAPVVEQRDMVPWVDNSMPIAFVSRSGMPSIPDVRISALDSWDECEFTTDVVNWMEKRSRMMNPVAASA